MKMQWAILIGLLFAIIISVFAIVNVEEVPVNYIFGEAHLPLILVILGSTLIGALISASFATVKIFGLRRKLKFTEKQLDDRDTIIIEKDREIMRLQEELEQTPPLINDEHIDPNL